MKPLLYRFREVLMGNRHTLNHFKYFKYLKYSDPIFYTIVELLKNTQRAVKTWYKRPWKESNLHGKGHYTLNLIIR